LAGGALTITIQWIRQRWLRPRIEILFRNAEPGCCVDTNVVGGTEPVHRYVRLKVINVGRSTALGVTVCVTKLTFTAPGAGSRLFAEEVLDLKLSMHEGTAPFPLAPGAHRYIDLAHTNRNDRSHWYDFHIHPARLREQGFGTNPGTYGAEIFLVAENAKAVPQFVTWSWDGGFPGLTIP
jgi:hypothetical protein